MHLKYGVPQGSVLGPRLYCLFSKPIDEICWQHDMDYHCYTDDTQVYLVIEPLDKWTGISNRIEACLADISEWMRSSLLKLNQDKTEVIVFAPTHRVKDFSDCRLSFDGIVVSDVSCVRNLGVFFDKALSMEKRVSATSKSCFYQIRNIGRIRTYITDDACMTLVNSLVPSRLDYGNAMLYGLPVNITNKLQRVQNTTAWLISRTKKHQHITPILVSLHWLPVHYRCQYQLLMYVFKSLHGSAPIYLQELVSVYQPTRSLRSENSALIKPPRIRTKTYGEWRFDKAAATLWNILATWSIEEWTITFLF
jgi:hypothetical protein